jgi:thiosulfate/3-mercaptopyruvate sulfurtransferase
MLPAQYDRLSAVTKHRAILNTPKLAALLRMPDPPTLLDVRWVGLQPDRDGYAGGHLPGAVFADLEAGWCGPPGPDGRHPLPEPAALRESLRRLGVRAGHPVVVYEAGGPNPTGAAARAWWTLRWAGHPDVRVLDGGFAAWVAAGELISTDEPVPAPGDFVVRPGGAPVWTPSDAAGSPGVLIDARIAPRFRGEVEPVDPVAGHIPGAVNQPVAATVDEGGLLRAPEVLRRQFEALGVRADRPVGAYCGSGITAAQTVLALHEAGFEPALYVGSWSHWVTDPSRPIATGPAKPSAP